MDPTVAFPCPFADCERFAVAGEGALVALLGGSMLLLVCDRCRERLRLGRPPGTVGKAVDSNGLVHPLYVLARPEAHT